ncbi:MAG: hypothetical protein J7502_15775, partial [Flavisolibacter sp.]|nr:hypothetical protein [Flavisolibacter sp.]
LTPPKIYLLWALFYFLFLVIGIPIYNNGHSGGEQRPLTFIAYSINYFLYGIICISFIIIPVFFLNWFKRYWVIPIAIGILFLVILIGGLTNK